MRSKTAIGDKIYALRKKMGLTQGELAGKVGVSRAAVSQFELGDTTPSQETQKKLSGVLGFDFTDLWAKSPPLDKTSDNYINLDYFPIEQHSYMLSWANEDIPFPLPMNVTDNYMSVIQIPGIAYEESFVVEIKGNSMSPRYPHQSRYVIKQIPTRENELRFATGVHLFLIRERPLLIRRVISTANGMLTLKADATGEEIELLIDEIEGEMKFGRCFVFKLGQAAFMPPEE